MDTKKLNEKESLDLIASMIRNTRNNLESRGGKSLLIWGYTTIGVSILVYLLLNCSHNWHYSFLWFIIPIVGGICEYLNIRNHPRKVTTYIDQVTKNVWRVIGLVALLTSIATFLTQIPILFFIALLISMGGAISGLIIKSKTLTTTGFIGILLSYSLLIITGLDSILIFAATFLLMCIIPGHLLNRAATKKSPKQEQHV